MGVNRREGHGTLFVRGDLYLETIIANSFFGNASFLQQAYE